MVFPDDSRIQQTNQANRNTFAADESLTQTFQDVVAELKRNYEVPDIVLPSSRLIFILESPHVSELEYGAPVSGSSGATMTRHLFGTDYAKFPLGRLVKKNADEQKDRPRLNRIGLINVSNIPLQSSAYRNRDLVQQYKVWFDAMSSVRQDNARDSYGNPYCQAVQTTLVTALRQRLEALSTHSCTIVPCGRFAQKFFRLTNQHSPNWNVIKDVPHPSYNSWDRERYRTVINAVSTALGTDMTGSRLV